MTTSTEKTQTAPFTSDVLIYEYMSAANPDLPPIPCLLYPSKLHQEGETRIIPFDLSDQIHSAKPATAPNVMAAYLRILSGENLTTEAVAAAQLFYVIRGQGYTVTPTGILHWSEGDVFVLPATGAVQHYAKADTALYWVNDAPLLTYLGAKPTEPKFKAAHYSRNHMMETLDAFDKEPGAEKRNRNAIILGNTATQEIKSMSPTLWAAIVSNPAGGVQRAHRHNSVAVDIIISCEPKGCYSLLGNEIDDKGQIINPTRVDWEQGAAFVTPPCLWHAHYNESDKPAVVMAVQDAAFHEHMRTLDIRFT